MGVNRGGGTGGTRPTQILARGDEVCFVPPEFEPKMTQKK